MFRVARRTAFVAVHLCLGLCLLLVFSAPAAAQELTPAELFERVAGDVGDSRNSYRMTRTIETYTGGDTIAVVTVRSDVLEGRVIGTTERPDADPGESYGATVEDLFAAIAQAEADGRTVEAEYDRFLGHPTMINITWGNGFYQRTMIEPLEWGVVDPWQVTTFERQRSGWQASAITDYEFVFTTGCGECLESVPVRIFVEDSAVVRAESLEGDELPLEDHTQNTIDGLLDRLEISINDPGTRVGVTWADFIPVRAGFDLADPQIADGDGFWTITEYRPVDGTGRDDIQAQLSAARDLLRIPSYSLTYRVSCFCPSYDSGTVTVHRGEIVSVEGNASGEPRTWESIFDEIQAALDNNVDRLTVNFAMTPSGFTYITDYSIDPSINIADEEYGVIIENFEIGYVDPVELAAAEAAVALWEAQGPSSYSFDISVSCFCPPPLGPISVTVVDGVVTSVEPADSAIGDGRTIDQLLAQVLGAAQSASTNSSATFDPTYGYPLTFSSGPVDPRLQDGGYSFRITNFTPTDRVGCFEGPVQAERGMFAGRMGPVRNADAVEGGALGVIDGPSVYTFDESNIASYCIRLATAGVYRLDASVIAPDPQSDSVWARIDDNEIHLWDFKKGAEWHTDFLRDRSAEGPVYTILEAGTHRIEFYLRETGALIDEFNLVKVDTIGEFQPAVCGDGLAVEAEDGSFSGAMTVFSDATASGREYASIVDGIDREYTIGERNFVEYCIRAPERGTYTIEATTIAKDFRSDSFYVQIDDGEPFVWHVPRSEEWQSSKIRRAGSGGPARLDLSSGRHRIRLYHREPTALDSVRLVPEDLASCPNDWQRATLLNDQVSLDFPPSYDVSTSVGDDTETFLASSEDDRNVFELEVGPGSPFEPASFSELPDQFNGLFERVDVPGCGPGRVGGTLFYVYIPGQEFRPGYGTLFVPVDGEYQQVMNVLFGNIDEVQQILATAVQAR